MGILQVKCPALRSAVSTTCVGQLGGRAVPSCSPPQRSPCCLRALLHNAMHLQCKSQQHAHARGCPWSQAARDACSRGHVSSQLAAAPMPLKWRQVRECPTSRHQFPTPIIRHHALSSLPAGPAGPPGAGLSRSLPRPARSGGCSKPSSEAAFRQHASAIGTPSLLHRERRRPGRLCRCGALGPAGPGAAPRPATFCVCHSAGRERMLLHERVQSCASISAA